MAIAVAGVDFREMPRRCRHGKADLVMLFRGRAAGFEAFEGDLGVEAIELGFNRAWVWPCRI